MFLFVVYVDCRYVVFINLFELLLTHFLWKACAGEVAVHLSYKMVFLLKKNKNRVICDIMLLFFFCLCRL